MMHTRGNSGWGVVVALALCCVLLLSCSATREQAARSYIWKIGGVERVDSTLHPYRLNIIRYYDLPSGVLEREEVEQVGEIREVVREVRDTVFIAVRDTVSIVKEPAVIAPAGGRRSNWYWWLLSGMALVLGALAVVKLWRNGR